MKNRVMQKVVVIQDIMLVIYWDFRRIMIQKLDTILAVIIQKLIFLLPK